MLCASSLDLSRTTSALRAKLCASEARLIMRTSAPGSLAVARSIGIRSFVRRAGPIWFVPSWVSNPSFVVPRGSAITPALFIKMSRRCDWEVNVLAALDMESKEQRSRCM